MVGFHKIWKKYNEIKLTKNKMDLNNRKIKIVLPPPQISHETCHTSGQEMNCIRHWFFDLSQEFTTSKDEVKGRVLVMGRFIGKQDIINETKSTPPEATVVYTVCDPTIYLGRRTGKAYLTS